MFKSVIFQIIGKSIFIPNYYLPCLLLSILIGFILYEYLNWKKKRS
ncbi:hypothetical protein [Companilactobacillus hulinensis]|nr:hypothetical protein [Companilactobacillus hulinensis]